MNYLSRFTKASSELINSWSAPKIYLQWYHRHDTIRHVGCLIAIECIKLQRKIYKKIKLKKLYILYDNINIFSKHQICHPVVYFKDDKNVFFEIRINFHFVKQPAYKSSPVHFSFPCWLYFWYNQVIPPSIQWSHFVRVLITVEVQVIPKCPVAILSIKLCLSLPWNGFLF